MTDPETSEHRASIPSLPPLPAGGPDAELEALPAPRHPWRRLTLVCMSVTLLAALALLVSLRGELWFSFLTQGPHALGELSALAPASVGSSSWVQGEGELEVQGAIAYRRPLEADSYRLARVRGTDKLWVQVRVPWDEDDPEHRRFVAPTSFVGRLVPAAHGGLRLSNLSTAIAEAGRPALPGDAWLLIDGEAPSSTRWTLGVAVLLLGFAGFNLFGLLRLLRPVTD